jgi:hypothetical protein
MNYPPIQCLHGLYWRCEACGTLTRTDDCDCTKMNTGTQRLVPFDPKWISESELKAVRAINAELVEALKPFAAADKPSLVDTLGHINREHIEKARAALAKAKEQK